MAGRPVAGQTAYTRRRAQSRSGRQSGARAARPAATHVAHAGVLTVAGPAHFILYVADQAAATAFWTTVLDHSPTLDVPGMTEFALAEGTVLGLMPEAGIRALLGPALPDPASARGVPRCELYLVVADPGGHHARALAAGARELSPLTQRTWGDEAAYCLDRDGHVVAFASRP